MWSHKMVLYLSSKRIYFTQENIKRCQVGNQKGDKIHCNQEIFCTLQYNKTPHTFTYIRYMWSRDDIQTKCVVKALCGQ